MEALLEERIQLLQERMKAITAQREQIEQANRGLEEELNKYETTRTYRFNIPVTCKTNFHVRFISFKDVNCHDPLHNDRINSFLIRYSYRFIIGRVGFFTGRILSKLNCILQT